MTAKNKQMVVSESGQALPQGRMWTTQQWLLRQEQPLRSETKRDLERGRV